MVSKVIISTTITLHIVRASPVLLSTNRHAAKESCKRLLTLDSSSAVVNTTSKVNSTTGVNNKGLKVGRALGKQLASIDSCISNNRGVIADTSTKDSVV